jgi:hypothetical protein
MIRFTLLVLSKVTISLEFPPNFCMSIPCSLFFFILDCEAIGTAATPGLLCQPRVIVKMIVDKQMECNWQGKPKFSEKTCPSATMSTTNPT